MYDDLLISKLQTCLEHIEAIETNVGACSSAKEFFNKNEGANYDGWLMRLHALGERLKNIIQKHPFVNNDLNYPETNNVIRFRDFMPHHYEQLEHESVYEICRYKIPELKSCVLRLLSDK